MTFATHTLTGAAGSHAASHGVGTVLKSWWDAYWTRRAQQTTVMMLSALDDHCLHDIGIDRSEIESVVYGKTGERRLRYE